MQESDVNQAIIMANDPQEKVEVGISQDSTKSRGWPYENDYFNVVNALRVNWFAELKDFGVIICSKLGIDSCYASYTMNNLLMECIPAEQWNFYYKEFLHAYGSYLNTKSTYRMRAEEIIEKWDQKIRSRLDILDLFNIKEKSIWKLDRLMEEMQPSTQDADELV